ncbi:hypothetical protein BDW22DRAFT_1343398 [Trametopsis cervina]|nr:hypothetical protein BDW22DRAFT_1343398 [Trametopsis cervina]
MRTIFNSIKIALKQTQQDSPEGILPLDLREPKSAIRRRNLWSESHSVEVYRLERSPLWPIPTAKFDGPYAEDGDIQAIASDVAARIVRRKDEQRAELAEDASSCVTECCGWKVEFFLYTKASPSAAAVRPHLRSQSRGESLTVEEQGERISPSERGGASSASAKRQAASSSHSTACDNVLIKAEHAHVGRSPRSCGIKPGMEPQR